MNYFKIFDSYQSQRDLEKLVSAICYKLGEETYNRNKYDTVIRYTASVTLNDFKSDFGILNQFIIDFKDLAIHIEDSEELKRFTTGKAAYIRAKDTNGELIREILLGDRNIIKTLNDTLDGDFKDIRRIASIFSNTFRHSLIHELQHAYDDWRSKGKFDDKLPKNFTSNQDKYKSISNKMNNLKEEELDFLSKHHVDYLNLPFEVDARFTVAISKTSFYEYDLDKALELEKDYYTIKPFEKVLADFKRNMYPYHMLNDVEKKRVLRKLGQFYEIEREFVKKINDEAQIYK